MTDRKRKPVVWFRVWYSQFMTLTISLLLFAGCTASSDPLARYDDRYTEIMVRLGVAERDTARNVRRKEARERRSQAEADRIAFLRDPDLVQAIDRARLFQGTPFVRLKAEAYERERQIHTAWTPEEKIEENQLLARLEKMSSQEASWSSADGGTHIALNQNWATIGPETARLSEAERAELFAEYIDVRMQVVDQDLQSLVTLRNDVARRAGYKNYWALSLAEHGLNDADVLAFIDELKEIVAPLNDTRARSLRASATALDLSVNAANLPLLEEWSSASSPDADLDRYFDADLAEERIVTAFQDMGMPADSWQVYVEPRRYARAGAYGYPIRPPKHVAIVISQDRRWSTWQYEALAHEGAHAVWWQSLSPEQIASPPMWSPPAPWGEGVAGFFERLLYEPSFTERYVPELPAGLREAAQMQRTRDVAYRLTDGIIDTLTERQLYAAPDDLMALTAYAGTLRAELTGLPLPPTDERGLRYDPSLLSGLTWVYPAYSANFLYAYATECQLFEAVYSQLGDPVGNAAVGPLLKERIIQADPSVPIPQHLATLLPAQSQTAALQRYFKPLLTAPTLPAPPEETADATAR